MSKDIKELRIDTTINFEKYPDFKHPEITKAECLVAYHGANRNGSYISKDTFEKEDIMQSLVGIPVVGEYWEKSENFKNHGGKLEISDEGIEYVMTTKPYGAVVEPNPRWVEVTEKDGTVNEYLAVDIYLWTGRYEELEVVKENGANQSMEIIVNDSEYKEDEEVFDIKDFHYSALCILGKDERNEEFNQEPCFESASIVAYSLDKKEFQKELNQFMKMVKEYNISEEEVGKGDSIEIDNSKESANMEGEWGEVDKTELKNELMSASNYQELVEEAYLIVPEDVVENQSELKYPHHEVVDGKLVAHRYGLASAKGYFDTYKDEMTEEEYNAGINHLNRHYEELEIDEEEPETEDGQEEDMESHEDDKKEEFELTYGDKREILWKALVESKDTSAYLMDFSDEFVYYEIYVSEKFANYKESYLMDESGEVVFGGDAVEVYHSWLTAEEKASFELKDEEIQKLENEILALNEYKEQKENEEYQRQVNEIFEEFDKNEILLESEEYSNLKQNAIKEKIDCEQIKKEVFALLGALTFEVSTGKGVKIMTSDNNKKSKFAEFEYYASLAKSKF